jgi:flagellar hook assembly protein FlgD
MANDIEINIYNLMGQKVATLVSEKQSAGNHQVEWNAKGFASGVYYYTLRTEAGFVQTRKLMLIK